MAHANPVLPDAVIGEILSFLPVKSLLRFRCVSKYWNSLISSPDFAKLHLQRSPKDANVILALRLPGMLYDFQVMPSSIHSLIQNRSTNISVHGHCFSLKTKYSVVDSCNGLVCFCGSEGHLEKYWVRFWNPALRIRSRKSPCFCVDLCSNKGNCMFGFGYDKSSDTFKVVAVNVFNKSKTTQVKVYTMGDHCWRDIERFPAFPYRYVHGGNFVSGTLNWLATRNSTSNELVIVSLDLKKETYKQFSLPVDINELHKWEVWVGVLGDCLCLFHHSQTHFVTWQMKEFGVEQSWTQFVNICYQQLQRPFISLDPMCILEDGDVLLLLSNDHEIILYNRKDKTVEHIKIDHRIDIDAKDYVQSLILPR